MASYPDLSLDPAPRGPGEHQAESSGRGNDPAESPLSPGARYVRSVSLKSSRARIDPPVDVSHAMIPERLPVSPRRRVSPLRKGGASPVPRPRERKAGPLPRPSGA